jgi:hypothetical protein
MIDPMQAAIWDPSNPGSSKVPSEEIEIKVEPIKVEYESF